jgi:hypothetical protein
MLLLLRLAVRLVLLLSLIHGIQNTEVMFRVLEVGFCRNPVSTTGRVAAELEVFLEELLGGTANADFRPIAVEDVVPIERNVSARVMPDRAARSTAITATTARAMVTATHAFHVHMLPSCFPIIGGPMGMSGALMERPRGSPLANHDPSALMMAREGFV